MKSIKQQYIDLTEGRMSQNNFMRSMRMSLPQYVTNVSSFKDTVKILKNKGIISEMVDNSEGEYENLVNTILKYVKDPDEARQYAESDPQQWPDWLKANMDIDSEMGLNEDADSIKVNQPDYKGTIRKVDGGYELYDVNGNVEDKEVGPFGTISSLMSYYEINQDQLNEDAENTNMHDPEAVAKVVVQKHGAELKPLFDEYQASYEEYRQAISKYGNKDPKFREIEKANNKLTKEFQNAAIDLAGDEMLKSGMSRTQVGNLLSGYGYFEDWLSDFISALNADLKSNKQDMPGFEGTLDALNNLYEAKESNPTKDGKALYAHFSEINNMNGQEVFTGIGIEHECYPEKSYAEIEKIVIKNLKKNQFYYTDYKLSGVAGAEPKVDGNINPEDRTMKPVKDGNIVDKKMGMKPVKGFANAKASANKAHKETVKGEKVDLMSLIAQTVRGLVKMDATGEKGKKIAMKEARLNLAPGEEPNAAVAQALQFIEGNNELKAISDKISLQNSHQDAVLRYGYWEQLDPALVNKLGLQFKVNEDYEFDDERGSLYAYILTPKSSMTAKTPGEAVAKALTKEDIEAMVREVMDETFDGRDNLIDPIAAEEDSNN